MKDLLLYLVNSDFVSLFIGCAVGGLVAGMGSALLFSMLGYTAYKTFNLLERSGS